MRLCHSRIAYITVVRLPIMEADCDTDFRIFGVFEAPMLLIRCLFFAYLDEVTLFVVYLSFI